APKHQLFYKSQINRLSKHVVYSTMKILSVVSVKVKQQFGYGYLQKIVVIKADRKLYTFKEGNFPNLQLNDIKDMLLLHVQNKLFNLNGDNIVDLAVALRILTRRIIIQKRVKDVQLGRKLPKEAQHHQATKGFPWNLSQRVIHHAAKLQVGIQQRHAKEKMDRQGPKSHIHYGESD
nr:hypothetical protein [Tanacetum cinerariifolium]